MKFTITAVIPTVQYGNIQPSIEVEAETFEEAQAYAMPKIEALWAQYAEKPLNKKGGEYVRLVDYFGNEIDYDAANHQYAWQGVPYMSASTIAKGEQKPFDSALMSGKVAEKTGSDPAEIAKLWSLSGQVSRDFGTTVHLALELYGKYQGLAKTLDKEYHTPNHTVLKDIVESFYKGRENEKAEYEVLVVDHAAKRAGTIDRLQIVGDKTVIIEDYKIAYKTDEAYWKKQLGVYEGIMVANGWTVLEKRVYQYDGKWATHTYKAYQEKK